MMNYLKKYNKFGKTLRNTINKEFGSDLVYNKKYLKAKIKSFNRKITADFHNNKYQNNVLNVFNYH